MNQCLIAFFVLSGILLHCSRLFDQSGQKNGSLLVYLVCDTGKGVRTSISPCPCTHRTQRRLGLHVYTTTRSRSQSRSPQNNARAFQEIDMLHTEDRPAGHDTFASLTAPTHPPAKTANAAVELSIIHETKHDRPRLLLLSGVRQWAVLLASPATLLFCCEA